MKIIGPFNKQSRNSVLNVKIIGTLKQAERRLRLSLIVKLQTLRRFGSNSRHGSYCVRRYTAQYEGVDVLTLPRLQGTVGCPPCLQAAPGSVLTVVPVVDSNGAITATVSPNYPPTHNNKFPCCWAHTDTQLDTRAPQFYSDTVMDTQYLKKEGY